MKIINIISHIFAKSALAAAFVSIGLSSFSQTTENLGGYEFTIETDDEGQYYKVDCPEALSAIVSYTKNAYASGKRFKQTADITLSETFEPLHYVFSGIYDGNNMTISGLYTERAGRIALFGYLKNATVKNVILLNPSNEATASDEDDIASLVGYSLESRIENCKVINPSLTWKHSNPYIGVIVAECTQKSTIKDCYVYSTEYSAYAYHSNTCTIENVGSMYKITSKDCSFSSSAMVTVDGIVYCPNGAKITLSATNPIPTGYYESYKVNGTAINGNIYTINGADVEITATSPISYSITYNGIDGATFSTTNPSTYTVESDDITLVNPTREGYTFLGWTYDGQTEPIESVTISKGSTGNKEFTANWAKNLTTADIGEIENQTYTGSALTPVVTVTDGETTLTENTDYTVTFPEGGCVNTGDYTITITGTGNYSGTMEKTFTITPKITVFGALTLTQDQNGITATIEGNYDQADALTITDDIAVNSVTYSRTFTADGGAYTIMLPFSFTVTNVVKGTFHTLSTLEPTENETVWKATMSEAITTIEANKPYIFVPSEDFDEMTFENVTLEKTTSAPLTNVCENQNWKLHGVYSKKTWTDEDENLYGFAAAAKDDISVGEFVHFVTGATLKATRCYLEYSKDGFSKSAAVLPERIILVFPDETASVTEPNAPEDSDTDITTPVSEIAPNSGVKVWSYDGTIYIESQPNTDYTIIDLTGRTLLTGVTTSTRETVTLTHRAAGIVIVVINGKTFKINY